MLKRKQTSFLSLVDFFLGLINLNSMKTMKTTTMVVVMMMRTMTTISTMMMMMAVVLQELLY